jgi:multidrug resistance efflux pump
MSDTHNPKPTDDGNTTLSDRVRSLRLGNRPQARKSSPVLPWAVCVILLGMTAAFGYRAYRVQPTVVVDPSALSADSAVRTSTGSSTELPTSKVADTGTVVLQAKGYVTPISLVQVSPKVGGQLVWIDRRFEEGNIFRRGDPLAEIEMIDYLSDYEQARHSYLASVQHYEEQKCYRPEEVKQALADLDESRRTMTQLKLDLERNRKLTPGLALATKDMEVSQFSYESMAARVNKLTYAYKLMELGPRKEKQLAAQADMRQARAVLDKAEWKLDNCVIRAPISGTILTKKAELGNIVNPSAFSSGISASLCEMADLRRLEIDLSIQERDVANVHKLQRCFIMPEAYQADKAFLEKHPQGYVGYVSRLMPTADRAKGAVPVRVRIPRKDIPPEEAGVYLRPDMGALVSFTRDALQPEAEENDE